MSDLAVVDPAALVAPPSSPAFRVDARLLALEAVLEQRRRVLDRLRREARAPEPAAVSGAPVVTAEQWRLLGALGSLDDQLEALLDILPDPGPAPDEPATQAPPHRPVVAHLTA